MMRIEGPAWIIWLVGLLLTFLIGFLLLVSPSSAGSGNSTGNANYEDYIDVPVSKEISSMVNGVDTTGQVLPPLENNVTHIDFNGNPYPKAGEPFRYYGEVYTPANSTIQANILLPIWLNYTMPAKFNATEAPYPIYTLDQGQDVYLDTHYDISNALAGTGVLAWFASGEPSATERPVLLELPYQTRGYYDFYLDPSLFGPYPGNWYKWTGTYNPNENMHAFYLTNTLRNASLTFGNGTVTYTNISVIPENATFEGKIIDTKVPELPEVRVSDYLLARGDPLSVTFNNTWKLWLFGSTSSILDQRDYNGTVDIGADAIQALPAGRFKLVEQTIGHYATDFLVRYNQQKDSYEWFDPASFSVKTESITTIKNTWLSYDKLMEILPLTHDRYTVWNLELQEPEITINLMEEIGTRTAKDYYLMDDVRGNVSFQKVKGYTNMAPGTKINVYLDYLKGARDQKPIVCTVEDNGGPGYKKVWNATLVVYYEGLAAGMHSITVMTDSAEFGPVTQGDFMINQMPSNTYVPAQTVKWVGDVNPWSLNTTVQPPQIVEQIVEKQVQVVKEVPPSPEVVKQQQFNALVDLAIHIIVVLGLVGLALYARSVYKRAKEIKRKKEWMRWKK